MRLVYKKFSTHSIVLHIIFETIYARTQLFAYMIWKYGLKICSDSIQIMYADLVWKKYVSGDCSDSAAAVFASAAAAAALALGVGFYLQMNGLLQWHKMENMLWKCLINLTTNEPWLRSNHWNNFRTTNIHTYHFYYSIESSKRS